MQPIVWRLLIAAWAVGSRFFRTTIGWTGLSRSCFSCVRNDMPSGQYGPGRTMMANGCSTCPSRCFSSSADSSMQAIWNPPIPRMARMGPASSSSAASRIGSRPIHLISLCIEQVELRSARSAGDGLCMVAPAGGIRIFPCTGRAQGEFRHGGPLTVIRERRDDAVAGSAVHAGRCPVICHIFRLLKNIVDARHRRSRYRAGSSRSVNR